MGNPYPRMRSMKTKNLYEHAEKLERKRKHI
jgi:hypothetical protein